MQNQPTQELYCPVTGAKRYRLRPFLSFVVEDPETGDIQVARLHGVSEAEFRLTAAPGTPGGIAFPIEPVFLWDHVLCGETIEVLAYPMTSSIN